MSRQRISVGVPPDDLHIVPGPWPRLGRPIERDVAARTVTGDRPERVPVTQAEVVDVELFGPCR